MAGGFNSQVDRHEDSGVYRKDRGDAKETEETIENAIIGNAIVVLGLDYSVSLFSSTRGGHLGKGEDLNDIERAF